MDSIYLMGAEDVSSAASSIRLAAEGMQSAASWMTEALQQHQRFLDDWLARFEAVLTDHAALPKEE
jgi:hypothetical protein